MTDSKNIKIAIVLVTSLFFLWGSKLWAYRCNE